MYAIQVGNKFAKIEHLFAETANSEIWNVVVSATPKTYKSRVVAENEMASMSKWLDHKIARAQEVITSTEAFVAKNRKAVDRLEAKLEGLLDLPFREVERQVAQTRRAIAKATDDIRSSTPSIASFKQDLARYNKIRSAGARVVLIQQTVEAL